MRGNTRGASRPAVGHRTGHPSGHHLHRAGADNTPFDNFDNPVVCAKTVHRAYDESRLPLLNQSDGHQDGLHRPREPALHRALPALDDGLQHPPGVSVDYGDYLLQMTSTADLSNPPSSLTNHDPAVSTGG